MTDAAAQRSILGTRVRRVPGGLDLYDELLCEACDYQISSWLTVVPRPLDFLAFKTRQHNEIAHPVNEGSTVSDETNEGLLSKYNVTRAYDPPGKHDHCRYFVLDPQHDLIARRALAYYANDAREEGYAALADDLEAWVRSLWDASGVSPSGDYPQDGSDEPRAEL